MKNELYESAVDHIRDEMAGTKDDAIQAVGEMMTEQLRAQPQISEFVQKKGKTLRGAYQAISDYASKHRTGTHAVVPPAKAMELIAAYYGFTPTEGKFASNEETQAHAEEAARPSGALNDPHACVPLPYAGAPAPATVAVEGNGLPSVKAARPAAALDDELDLDKLLEG